MKASRLVILLLAGLVSAGPGLAQTAGSAPTDSEVADVARFVADRAGSVTASAPSSDLEAEARGHVEKLGALASQLETAIRAGESKEATRRLYEELRARRVAVIGLAMQGDIGVSAADIQVFEGLLNELSAYFNAR